MPNAPTPAVCGPPSRPRLSLAALGMTKVFARDDKYLVDAENYVVDTAGDGA
ncbi:MAG TPA: hypothetical protein VGM77_04445 [Gemmatimonadales bacterium]